MTTHSLNQTGIPVIPAGTDMQWILDGLMQSEMMLMGLYTDSTEDDLLSIYSQYPLGLLEDLLLQLAHNERYACCDAIRQVIVERSALCN